MKDETGRKIFEHIFLIGISIAIAFTILGFSGQFDSNLNEDTMNKICKSYRAEEYIYKTGYSEKCGFDVYRGICTIKGIVILETDYLLVNGKTFDFDMPIEFPEKELNNLSNIYYSDYDEQYNKIMENYYNSVCEYLGSKK